MSVSRQLRSNVELNKTVEQLWICSLSKKTQSVYGTGFAHYKRFLLLNNINFVDDLPPISEDNLIFFVAHCFKVLNLHYTTIKLYLCGIRYHYLKANCNDPLALYNGSPLPRLSLILNSIKKSQTITKKVRLPITFDILEQIVLRLQKGVFSSFIDLMLSTACIVSFFGFMRCGEITVQNASDFDPAVSLCISDINFINDFATLTLKRSKTDPFKKGITIQFHKIDRPLCPYIALQNYLHKRKQLFPCNTESDPLFVTEDGIVLQRSFFINKVRHVLDLCGYNAYQYSGHSFRIGAGTTAGQAKIEDHMIKTLGRWSSDCYCTYIRTQPKSIKSAQQQLADISKVSS